MTAIDEIAAERRHLLAMQREPRCHSSRDGEDCFWSHCPQKLDNEPKASGRHCPLDCWTGDDEYDDAPARAWIAERLDRSEQGEKDHG